MPKQILIVEDERTIAENYRDAFARQGFQVNLYSERLPALEACRQQLPDLALIDIGLGSDFEGGFELCRELRALSSTLPIIFLTARDSELDQISGLRLGADDYLTKDISLSHLLARVNALLRRVDALRSPQREQPLLERGALRIDNERLGLYWQGQPVDLTVTEFWIVHALARHPGHVKSRQQLMDAANVVLDDHTITSHIKRIRRKFEQLDNQFSAIQTVYGMGYRWLPEAE